MTDSYVKEIWVIISDFPVFSLSPTLRDLYCRHTYLYGSQVGGSQTKGQAKTRITANIIRDYERCLSTLHCFQLMVGSRFARAGYTTAFLSSSQPLWNFLSVSFRYCVFVQFGAHVAMAVNRYQVIANPVLNMVGDTEDVQIGSCKTVS